MSLAKPIAVCVLMAVLVSGCGIAAKPVAGSLNATSQTGFYNEASFERPVRVTCLQQHHLPVHLYRTADDLPAIRIGSGPSAPRMIFEPFGYASEDLKIKGQAQGAEVIGTVLLYPGGMSQSEAKVVEGCAAIGVP